MDYQIELDVSAACYFYAMSPLLGISVLVNHVHFDSLQGDVAFLQILEKMGCTARDTPEGILVEPPADGVFHGVTVDMSACSDQAMGFSLIGLKSAGIVIDNPGCCRKTFEEYFQVLDQVADTLLTS